MENEFLFEILVPILVFLTLSIFFVMMFIKNSWCACQKKGEKSETTNTQATAHHRSHGRDSGENDVTFIDLPPSVCCSCALQQQDTDALHAIHLHRTKREDDPPPTYDVAMAYSRHDHHSSLHLV